MPISIKLGLIMLITDMSEEILLTWQATEQNYQNAFFKLQARIFLKSKSCVISAFGILGSILGLFTLILNHSVWSFERGLLVFFCSLLVIVIGVMTISFHGDDFKSKKLEKKDFNYFLSQLSTHALKFFNIVWTIENKNVSSSKSFTYADLYSPFKDLKDKFAEDAKKIKEEEAKKKDITIKDILEIGESLLKKTTKEERLTTKTGSKRML